jgi:hypothetical protein
LKQLKLVTNAALPSLLFNNIQKNRKKNARVGKCLQETTGHGDITLSKKKIA